MHATGLANFNTSISQIHNYSTSMTLISPSPYLKTIIKYETSHSIQCTSMKVFILFLKGNFHVVLKDSKVNVSEAWEINYFYKIKPHHRALKDISEALEQKLYSSKDISEAHIVF